MASIDDLRPEKFKLPIQGGLLDNLGINMYANLGKCLVEFAANAFDSDSPRVDISLDAEGILAARADVRRRVRDAAKIVGAKPPSFIDNPLPAEFTVTIADSGDGMSPIDVQEKFLPINRNRRKESPDGAEVNNKTSSGRRFVMGRKGIGKLSSFGAATQLKIWTKRKGASYATTFVLNLDDLRNVQNLQDVEIAASYENDADLDRHGTVLTLENLKCDSMKFEEQDLHDALSEAFFPISDEEFAIRINGEPLRRPQPEYEFIWPSNREPDGFAVGSAGDDEIGTIPFRYVAKFRTKSLQAFKRGARIYCNGRLAFGPSLISLNTGTHNFMAHQYMEFIVEADELDRQNVDLISTNRGDILRNNDLVESFLAVVTVLMQRAIAAHAEYREKAAEDEFENDPKAAQVRQIIARMPSGQQTSGRKIVNVIVSRYGVESDEFSTIAPLLVTTMNAGEVLVDLIKASHDPRDVEQLAGYILKLREIEKSDALKVYRGRRDGISGLRTLINRGEDEWQKGKRNEAELHRLLKTAPWLIRPELSGYLASDNQMHTVLSVLAKALGVDEFAPPVESKDTKRPDLVFLLGNAVHADRILVVELKSTNLPLEMDHLAQLKTYMRKVREWLNTEYKGQGRSFVVQGILIGAMPSHDTKADGARDLLEAVQQRGVTEHWEVIGLRELLQRTEEVHRELIAALEAEVEGNPA